MRLPIAAATLLALPVFLLTGSQTGHAQTQKNQQIANNPPSKSEEVKVERGDTLSKIAAAHQTIYPRLYDANPNIVHPDLIYEGDKIRIPKPDEQLPHRPLPADASATTAPVQQRAAKTSSSRSTASYATPSNAGIWASLARCESGGNWAANTGNGYYGGLQFTISSWRAAGGSGYPNQASSAEQIARAQILQSRQGWNAWPACSAKLGL